ncbi:MAG TPA: hypothetical protein VMY05_02840 [Acidobacteriota bacterium]|nr:hypothetical protein [Acidobacteriota bacterium]
MKVFVRSGLLVLAALALARADQTRVSYMFAHYSVGESAVENCYAWGQYRNIQDVLDTTTVTYGNDTARIVFRSYSMNNDGTGVNAISDTVPTYNGQDCPKVNYLNVADYQWVGPSYRNHIIQMATVDDCPILEDMFRVPGKQDSVFWHPFTGHWIYYTPTDSVWEDYDMVIIKNPYRLWRDPTQQKVDSIKTWYRELVDSLTNHPEQNFCLIMGTPLALNTSNSDNFGGDTARAKLIYDLATWFASEDFFTHSNVGAYRNVWKFDPYRLLCETAAGAANRYCLNEDYWAGYAYGSHLNPDGAQYLQDTLLGFIRQATQDILVQNTGTVTRQDIDRMIRDFKDGKATEQDVQDLIRRYNEGT